MSNGATLILAVALGCTFAFGIGIEVGSEWQKAKAENERRKDYPGGLMPPYECRPLPIPADPAMTPYNPKGAKK